MTEAASQVFAGYFDQRGRDSSFLKKWLEDQRLTQRAAINLIFGKGSHITVNHWKYWGRIGKIPADNFREIRAAVEERLAQVCDPKEREQLLRLCAALHSLPSSLDIADFTDYELDRNEAAGLNRLLVAVEKYDAQLRNRIISEEGNEWFHLERIKTAQAEIENLREQRFALTLTDKGPRTGAEQIVSLHTDITTSRESFEALQLLIADLVATQAGVAACQMKLRNAFHSEHAESAIKEQPRKGRRQVPA